MFESFEEKLDRFQLKNKKCSKKSIDIANRILSEYKHAANQFKDDHQISSEFKSIVLDDEKCIEKIALLIVIACHRSIGREWKIPGHKLVWDIVPRVPQIAGGIELCKLDKGNKFARQRTGEGKTITLLFVIAYLAKKGKVHVITANDYLAKRDQMWVGPILDMLGISNDWLSKDDMKKIESYKVDVLYGSDKEFTFDYLKDSIRLPGIQKMCSKRNYAVVDEADHILLDELATPIVLSKTIETKNTEMSMADLIVKELKKLQEEKVSSLIDNTKLKLKNGEVNETTLKKIIVIRHGGVCLNNVKSLYVDYYKIMEKSERLAMILTQTQMIESICKELYFIVDEQQDSCYFTEKGLLFIEDRLKHKHLFTIPDYSLLTYRIQNSALNSMDKEKTLADLNVNELKQRSIIKSFLLSLQAHLLLHIDQDYIIKDGSVELITKSIGRSDSQKRFNDELSLAVELKEGLESKGNTSIVSSTLLPNFIQQYKRFAALSGTIFPDQDEFSQIYRASIFNVPTFKDVIAFHEQGLIFKTKYEKHKALLKDVRRNHNVKRPILIGTNSVSYSEELSLLFENNGIKHKLLNARNEYEEADLVSTAGDLGSVLIATNIAGRGTDIKVDNPVNECVLDNYVILIKKQISKGRSLKITCYSQIEKELLFNRIKSKVLDSNLQIIKKICAKGFELHLVLSNNTKTHRCVEMLFQLGLHVIISETFSSRRVVNQLRGRTGRQGAPGSSSMFLSLEDDNFQNIPSVSTLVRKTLFGKFSYFRKMQSVHNYFISLVNRVNESNEKENRKERLFYDLITENHRRIIEEYREELLCLSIKSFIKRVINELISDIFKQGKKRKENNSIEYISGQLKEIFNIVPKFLMDEIFIDESLFKKINKFMLNHYLKIEKLHDASSFYQFIQETSCSIIDELWTNYLAQLSSIRDQRARGMYSGKDDKVYYINLITEFFNEILFSFRRLSIMNVFNSKLPNENKSSPTLRTSDLEDEISELIL